MVAEKLLQKVSKIKRPRGERGGQKVKAQKSLRARTERSEYQPKKDFPQVPQYGSQLRELPHPASAEVEPRELPSSSASGSQVKPASNEQAFTESRPEQVAEPSSSARLITSSHRSPHPGELSRDTRGEPLRPRVGPSNLTRGPPPSRVLIVTDLHQTGNCQALESRASPSGSSFLHWCGLIPLEIPGSGINKRFEPICHNARVFETSRASLLRQPFPKSWDCEPVENCCFCGRQVEDLS